MTIHENLFISDAHKCTLKANYFNVLYNCYDHEAIAHVVFIKSMI